MKLTVGTGVVDIESGLLTRHDGSEVLPDRERALLYRLVSLKGEPVPGEQLAQALGDDSGSLSRVQDTVRRLRQRIESDPSNPRYVLTVRGVGYRFAADEVAEPTQTEPVAVRTIRIGDAVFAPGERTLVRSDGVLIGLTELEVSVLSTLVDHAPRTVSREALSRAAWGGHAGARRGLDTLIYRLRQRIEGDGAEAGLLETVRGVGYRLHGVEVQDAVLPTVTLIGRAGLVEQVAAGLLPGALIDLCGPPGSGKTAVVQAVANRLAAQGTRVRSVSLAGLYDPRELEDHLLAQLDLPANEPAMLDRLGPILIVLDSVDRVALALRELLLSWRSRAPRARWLVASVAPLSRDASERIELPALSEAAAAELLAQRLRERDIPARPHRLLVDLANRLDRLPLALELAAARAGVLGLEGVWRSAERLSSAGALHRSLTESLELLTPSQRALVDSCAAFVDWVDADIIAGVAGRPLFDLADDLHALVQHSLMAAESAPDGGRRLRLLNVVKAHVEDELDDTCQDRLRGAHAQWFIDVLVDRCETPEGGGRLEPRLARLWPEVERAYDWALRSRPSAAARLLIVCCNLASRRGELRYARNRVPELLQRFPDLGCELRSELVAAEAWEALASREYRRARELFAQAIEGAAPDMVAHFTLWQNITSMRAGDLRAARDGFHAILRGTDATQLERGMARAGLVQLALARGAYDLASEHGADELEQLYREGLDITAGSLALIVGEAHLHAHRPAAARLVLERGREVLLDNQYTLNAAKMDVLLAVAAWEGGDRERALAALVPARRQLDALHADHLAKETALAEGMWRTLLGDDDRGAALLREGLRDRIRPWLEVLSHCMLARYAAQGGRDIEARDHLDLASRRAPSPGLQALVAHARAVVSGEEPPLLEPRSMYARWWLELVDGVDPSESQEL